jgi:type IX secretion system PorP/SprF family membrane protein
MKRYTLIFLISVLFLNRNSAQDAEFTQFFSVPLYLAPSFAGATQQHRIASTYRNQWQGLGGFNTYVLSYDHYFFKYNSGFGLYFMRDQAGTGKLGNTTTSAQYSYDFQFSGVWHIRPGINFQYEMYNLDFYKLVFRNQISESGTLPITEIPPTAERRGNIDAGSSFIVYAEKIWFGAAVDHLFRPNQSFFGDNIRLPIKYSVFGGTQVAKKSRLLKPADETFSIDFFYRQQAKYRQLDLCIYWFKVPMVMGVWYRGIPGFNSLRGDALSILCGLKLSTFSVGYSYDFTVSNLINASHGAHELSVIYEFLTTARKRKHAIPCPEF